MAKILGLKENICILNMPNRAKSMNTHPRHGWSRVEIIRVITRNGNVRVKIEVFMVQRYSESPEMGVNVKRQNIQNI